MTNEWKATEINTDYSSITFYSITFYSINLPKPSNYTCYMFGNRPGGSGIIYNPAEGQVPNRFVRFMMRICFGCLWVKND